VAPEFSGDTVSETLYTAQGEGSMVETLADARERFGVAVGSYPVKEGPNRLRLSGTDPDAVAEAAGWLRERVELAPER
jgi:hypothetical protein